MKEHGAVLFRCRSTWNAKS